MKKVYIVQQQLRLNDDLQQLEPKFDFSKAKEYGELVVLLGPNTSPFHAHSLVIELKEKLKHITPNDYLLLTGNPVLIGLVVAIAADYALKVNFLQWSGKDQKYIPITAEIFT